MERLALLRLAALEKRVKEGVKECNESLDQIRADGVCTKEQKIMVAKLKVALENMITEIRGIINQTDKETPELVEKVSEYTNLQEEAENVLIEIEFSLKTPKETENRNEPNMTSMSKLPKLELPHFEGDILKWSQFWDLFKSNVDSRKDLTDVDKLSYLLGVLDGEAKRTVGGLLMTNKNYQIALQQLNDRFGKPDKIIEAHYKAITKIRPAQNEVGECRQVFLEIEQHLRILESLNEKVNENNLLRMTVMEKFPQELKYEMQRAVDTEGYTLEVIRNSLKQIISAKENAMSQDENPEAGAEYRNHFTTETLISTVPSTSKKPVFKEVHNRNKKQIKRQQYSKSKTTQLFTNRQNSGPPGPPFKRSRRECILCSGDHYNDECDKFPTLYERKKQLKGRCFLCLRKQHTAENCTYRPKRCFHCKQVGKHNGCLCPVKFGQSINQTSTAMISHSKHETILQTALVTVSNDLQNKKLSARILYDTGSQKSYVTSTLANLLKLVPVEETDLTVYTFGSLKPKLIKTSIVKLKLCLKNDNFIEILAYVVPRITGSISSNFAIKEEVARLYPQQEMAKDVESDCPTQILIGSDYYYTFFPGGVQQIGENLFLIETVLGWIVSGQPEDLPARETLSFLTFVQGEQGKGRNQFATPDRPLNDDNIKDIWELEAIGIKDSPKVLEQDDVIEIFNKTVKFEDERYQVKWPWVEYPENLPLNYGLAMGRLKGLLKRLNHTLRSQYDTVIKDQLEKGVIEKLSDPTIPNKHPTHYLPHHCVVQEEKTTKLRIVYDASAKIKGKCSLNEYLYKGPQMLNDMVNLLLRFRRHQIGITADIEKAFLQVGLQPEDRDVTRFLWVKDIEKEVTDENLVHYRFCRVPFGIISSPFLLAATIRFHLAQKTSPETQMISESLYVDNLLLSTSSNESANLIYQKARSSLGELSMNIREWTSNSETFMMSIPQDQRGNKKTCTVLGLNWNTENDSLSLAFKPSILSKAIVTKRDALRIIASIFDPCGFVAPLTLPARLMFQSLWKEKYKWDDELPEEKLREWEQCASLFQAMSDFQIQRAYTQPSIIDTNPKCEYELHCFTDASNDAYAAVVYLRTSNNDEHSVSFVMSRSRLTPLRQRDQMTIPKLELMGVLIGTRLITFIRNALTLPNEKLFLWTDNQAVLGWLKSDRLLQPFVSHRVTEIKATKNITFKYIASANNPADIATRVLTTDGMPDLWIKGPKFLTLSKEHWPTTTIPTITATEDQPQQSTVSSMDSPILNSPDKLSTFSVMTTGESIMLSAPTMTIPFNTNEDQTKTSQDNLDEINVIKTLQRLHFTRESAGKPTELTKSLRLFIDDKGCLRCGGRLNNANLPYDQKFPILLPRDTEFTDNVIRRVHEQNYHVGTSHTLAMVRQRFWVPRGRGEVAKVIRKCGRCVKYGGGPFKLPEIPALPKERVASCPPFTYTGLDYFGPLTARQNGSTIKRWCCLFTCMAVRAIHLELVNDMSAEEFLHCLRRFVASKGMPIVIISDNAAQFKLTSEVLKAPFCKENNIQWRFIPQLSPWQGGFYERLVGLVKHCLQRTLNKILLTDTQLLTVLKEIESILNTRPLTPVGPEMDHILTPSDFMHQCGTINLDETNQINLGKATTTKTNLIDSWKKGKCALKEFYDMFRNQYLTSLQERPTFSHKQPRVVVLRTPLVGEAVQIKEESQSRAHWRVGRISELVASRDGKIRTARVTLPSGTTLTRSISHLYPLELDIEMDENDARPNDTLTTSYDNQNTPPDHSTAAQSSLNKQASNAADKNSSTQLKQAHRPTRKAAEAAKIKIKQLTNQLLVRASMANEEC